VLNIFQGDLFPRKLFWYGECVTIIEMCVKVGKLELKDKHALFHLRTTEPVERNEKRTIE
jgi:hypothetical protein